MRFGKPLDFSRYYGLEDDHVVLRAMTDEIMYELMKLSGQEYVDEYAQRGKNPLQALRPGPAEPSPNGTAPDEEGRPASGASLRRGNPAPPGRKAAAGFAAAADLLPCHRRSRPGQRRPSCQHQSPGRSWALRVTGRVKSGGISMRVGVLTGGGDCPGLNAVIRAVVRTGAAEHGFEFIGFRDGWRGPLEGDTMVLDVQAVRGILPHGGTILGSSRTNPLGEQASAGGMSGLERIKENLSSLGVDALIAIGGEDTLGVASRLHAAGVSVVGVPKTIDNDLGATDFTFGFDTAVNIAMEAIDRLHTTAESHHRALIVEVMGRSAGWIALHAGHGRRRQRHPDPGEPVRHRAGVRVRGAPVPDPVRAHRGGRRGRAPEELGRDR